MRVILDGLAARGFEVSECNAPLGVSTSARVRVLNQPWRLPGFVGRMLARWCVLTARALRSRRTRRPDVVLVGYMAHFDVVLARLLFPRTPIILDHLIFAGNTASDRNVRGGVRARMLNTLDRSAIRSADLVLVDTDEHASMVSAVDRHRTVVVPVGADASWFAACSPRPATPAPAPLSVVFYGLMTPLQGAVAIAEAVRDLGGEIQATIIGSGQDGDAVDHVLSGVPGVTRMAWVEPEALPLIVAAHDVGIGIFGTSDKARRVVPNKVYQSLAAGLAVVTSDTPPQRRMLGDSALVYSPPGDATALSAVLRRLSGDREEVSRLRAEARRLAPRFAADAVVEGLVERLNGGLGR